MSITHNGAELVSLAATVPGVCLSVLVFSRWRAEATIALKAGKKRTSGQWVLLGVAAGCLLEPLDSIFWAFPWTASYLESHFTGWLMSIGVYFNIPFRQSRMIISNMCHLLGYACIMDGMHGGPESKKVWMTFFRASVIGVAFSLTLWVIKHG